SSRRQGRSRHARRALHRGRDEAGERLLWRRGAAAVTDRAVLPAAPAVERTPAGEEQDDLTSLRKILLAPAEHEIRQLRARLDDRYAQARDVSAVLPQALVHCSGD